MRRLLPLAFIALAGCQYLNPDAGHFSCETTVDCGKDFECRPQFGGGGRCFRVGQCVDDETCEGTDQNCDGRVDETFPEQGEACMTGVPGVCAVGARVCIVGALSCSQTVMASAELCNQLDDDCDGMIDETFDFTSDEANCGSCARPCNSGTTCLSSRCEETRCDDGTDDDSDGRTDCLDDSCLGLQCVTPAPPAWKCGAVPPRDGGTDDGGVSDAGTPGDGGYVFGCYPPESDCGNGLDDDGDGVADCLDLDCDTRQCASGTMCTNLSCPGPG